MLAEGSRLVKGRSRIPRFTGNMPRIGHPGPQPPVLLPARCFTGNIPALRPAPAASFHGKHPRSRARPPNSPQWPSSRKAHTPGPPLPGRSPGREESHPGSLCAPQLRPEQAQLAEPGRRPALRVGIAGRLAHHQTAPRTEEAHRALGRGRRRSKAPGHHQVERPRKSCRRASSSARPQATDARSLSPSSLTAASRNEHRRRRGIEQDRGRRRPQSEQNQARHARARAEIEKSASKVAADGRRQPSA